MFPALSLCAAHCSALHGHLLPAPGEDSQSSALSTGTQHRHIPAQARLLKALQKRASSAALHALILVSSHRYSHPFLCWAMCAWGKLARASSGCLTGTGGCKGLQESPEAAEIAYEKLSEGKATDAPLVPINSHCSLQLS